MSQQQGTAKSTQQTGSSQTKLNNSYYAVLGLHPSASVLEIRRSYRELSKHYHPDTTKLPPEIAKAKFQQLNEAYSTLSHPERRSIYDLNIGYSRINVIQPPPDLKESNSRSFTETSHSAYLDPTDRPLSSGEIFALFILALTLLGCLLLAVFIGLTRENTVEAIAIFRVFGLYF